MRDKLQAVSAVLGFIFCILSTISASAAPIAYTYDQTSSSVPGFIVTGTIVVDDALPVKFTSNFLDPGPYNFGNILSLDLTLNGSHRGLGNFTPAVFPLGLPTAFPQWTIGGPPFFIHYLSEFDSLTVSDGMITYGSDGVTGCFHTCQADGVWVREPEPLTLSIFGVGALALAAMRRRRKTWPERC